MLESDWILTARNRIRPIGNLNSQWKSSRVLLDKKIDGIAHDKR